MSSVYPGHRVLAMFCFFNEGDKIRSVVERLRPGVVDKCIAIDDGSTDEGPAIVREHGIEVLEQPRSGIGSSLKRTIRYAKDHGYDTLVVFAGNNKDDPREIPRLLAPIVEGRADYVQGSRFLPGGSSPNLPRFRERSIRLLSFLYGFWMRRPCTDLTNGFRAYRVSLFDDPRINVWQDWLDTYEFEYYLHYKVYTLGYRLAEVPVTKAYPEDPNVSYSKIRPFSGWWSMLRPLVFLALRIKR